MLIGRQNRFPFLPAIGFVVLVVATLWYIYPVLGYLAFINGKVPAIPLSRITELPRAPETWESVDLGGFTMELPMSACSQASGNADRCLLTLAFPTCRVGIIGVKRLSGGSTASPAPHASSGLTYE